MSDGKDRNFVWIDRHGKRHTGTWEAAGGQTYIYLNIDEANTIIFEEVSLIQITSKKVELAYFVEEKVNNEIRKLSFVLIPA